MDYCIVAAPSAQTPSKCNRVEINVMLKISCKTKKLSWRKRAPKIKET